MARVVRFHALGGPEVLKVEDVPVPTPGAGEVQIRVRAMGINRADVMFRMGHYVTQPTLPSLIGLEAAGNVEAVGSAVDHVAVGDAVSVIPCFWPGAYGLHGELINAPAEGVVKHPAGLSWEEAAAAWMMFATAYGALVDIAGVRAGQAVLIRAASSSVGLAAIQIANALGAVPIAVTRRGDKRAALLSHGAAQVIAMEEQDIVEEMRRATGGEGASLALDPVGGPGVGRILETLSHRGKFFLYGALETTPLSVPIMALLGKDLTIRSYQAFEVTMDPARRERARRYIHDGLVSGSLKPVVSRVFELGEIAEAHRFMESNAQVGKVVVTVG